MDFTIADRLVGLRRAQGLSQESLAAALGLTRQAVSRWERGESLPDTENLIALADLYGVTLDELVRPQTEGMVSGEGSAAEAACEEPSPVQAKPEPAEPEPAEPVAAEPAQADLELAEPTSSDSTPEESEPVESVPVEPEPANGVPAEEPLAHEVPNPSPEPLAIPQATVPPEATMAAPQEESGAWRMGGFLAKVLAVLLCVGIVIGALSVGFGSLMFLFGMRPHAEEAVVEQPAGGAASTSESHYDPSEVRDLSISWGVGPVVIRVAEPDEADAVVVMEEYLDDDYATLQMRESLSNGELSIDYGSDARRHQASWGSRGKRLTVLIPQGSEALRTIRCDITSDTLEMRDLLCENMQVKLASGEAIVSNAQATDLRLDIASGNADVAGDFSGMVDLQVGSGDVTIASSTVPSTSDLQVASGDVTYRLPRDASFVARTQVASGDFDISFANKKDGDTYTVGKGGSSIDVSLASGDVDIVSGD